LRIEIKVKTSAKEDCIYKLDNQKYIIHLKTPRRKGKANTALIKLLSKHFNGRITILKGHTSINKIIKISID